MLMLDDYCILVSLLQKSLGSEAQKLIHRCQFVWRCIWLLTCLRQIWAWNFLQEVQLPKPLEALNNVQTPHCPTSNQALTKYCRFSTHEPSGIKDNSINNSTVAIMVNALGLAVVELQIVSIYIASPKRFPSHHWVPLRRTVQCNRCSDWGRGGYWLC